MSDRFVDGFPPENDPLVLQNAADEFAKVRKDEALRNLTISINGVEYDANTNGQLNMSAVGSVANWQFNLQMVSYLKTIPNPSPDLQGFIAVQSAIYKKIYKDTHVNWKGTDNKMHNVQVESILEALYGSMKSKEDILHKSAEVDLDV